MLYRADLSAQAEAYSDELAAAFERVMRSGRYVLGPEGELFEREFASYIGALHAVGVNSGTDALILAMEQAGIGAGDEVITTPFTAIPTGSAIARLGAIPRFVDIDADTFLMRTDAIEAAVTERTRAIMPVHIFGMVADMPAILGIARSHSLVVIEDAAQAHGSRLDGKHAGTFGDAGCFSFYPTKNLGAYGDAGAIVTNDASRADSYRRTRNYGKHHPDFTDVEGVNTRLDDLQAALLRVKLAHLDDMNRRRAELVGCYATALDGLPLSLQRVPPGCTPNHHVMTVRVHERRNELRATLESEGIQCTVFYPVPLYGQKAFSAFAPTGAERCQVAERLCEEVLSLPLYPEMSTDVVARVSSLVRAFYSAGCST